MLMLMKFTITFTACKRTNENLWFSDNENRGQNRLLNSTGTKKY